MTNHDAVQNDNLLDQKPLPLITKQPQLSATLWDLGIYGNNLCYLLAVQRAPIEHVVLIGYLWPIYIIFLAKLILKHAITKRHFMAALIGFSGILLLITQGAHVEQYNSQFLTGYLFAFASGCLWSIYCIATQNHQQSNTEVIGMYCGIGALLSLITYSIWGTPTTITPFDISLMILLGLTAFGYAFLFWDKGIKRGNFKLLCIASFAIPVIATALLVAFGKAQLSEYLILAVGCVTLATYLVRGQVQS